MSKLSNKRISVFSILIFVLCGLLAIYTVMAINSVSSYIGEMFEYGSISFSENWFDIFSYFMTNCGVYVVYICILLGIWWASDKKFVDKKEKAAVVAPAAPAVSDTDENAAGKAMKNMMDEDKDDKPAIDKKEEK